MLRSEEDIAASVESIRASLQFLLPGAEVVNNLDWLGKLGYLEVLRDIGKHFSVNEMVRRDSVRERLEGREQGISYTEFSYMLLQAYDFEHLYRHHGVTVQMGGSDQFGNIVSGADLIRRRANGQAFAITCPLLMKADGEKFGKSHSGAVWLGAHRTSPTRSTSSGSNADDADVERFLKIFTLLPRRRSRSCSPSTAPIPAVVWRSGPSPTRSPTWCTVPTPAAAPTRPAERSSAATSPASTRRPCARCSPRCRRRRTTSQPSRATAPISSSCSWRPSWRRRSARRASSSTPGRSR